MLRKRRPDNRLEHSFSKERETETGRPFLAFPVRDGVVSLEFLKAAYGDSRDNFIEGIAIQPDSWKEAFYLLDSSNKVDRNMSRIIKASGREVDTLVDMLNSDKNAYLLSGHIDELLSAGANADKIIQTLKDNGESYVTIDNLDKLLSAGATIEVDKFLQNASRVIY